MEANIDEESVDEVASVDVHCCPTAVESEEDIGSIQTGVRGGSLYKEYEEEGWEGQMIVRLELTCCVHNIPSNPQKHNCNWGKTFLMAHSFFETRKQGGGERRGLVHP